LHLHIRFKGATVKQCVLTSSEGNLEAETQLKSHCVNAALDCAFLLSRNRNLFQLLG